MKKDVGYSLLRSRKFWAALAAVAYSIIYVIWPEFPVSEESLAGVVAACVSYILGVALEDGLSKQNHVEIGKFEMSVKESESNEYEA